MRYHLFQALRVGPFLASRPFGVYCFLILIDANTVTSTDNAAATLLAEFTESAFAVT
jgi:hypothetical protein